jgi:hypothetical protein
MTKDLIQNIPYTATDIMDMADGFFAVSFADVER